MSISSRSNCMKPTLERITGTAKNASKYPPNHAIEEIINNSNSTMPLSLSAVAPIER